MFASISKIFSLGVREENPAYLNSKIKISNQIAFFSFFVVGAPFTIIFYLNVPNIIFIPVTNLVLTFFIPVLNHLRWYNFTRFFSAISGTLTVGLTHGFLVEKGGGPIPASIVFELSFAILPFIVFHAKEIKSLVSTSIFTLLFICAYQLRIDLLEIDHLISDVLNNKDIETFTIAMAVVQSYIFLLIIVRLNFKTEKQQQELVQEMNEQNEKLKDSQEVLENSLKSLDEGKIKEQNQLWITEGAAMVGKIVRSNLEGSEMYDEILSKTIKFIKANQGAFYIVNEGIDENQEKITFKQVSCYAYNRKKFTDQVFEPGEGLLGQCYFEKNVMLLTEIPDGYVNITSGIGEATPSCIVIIPLMLNEKVAGFLELAAFEVFDDTKIAFLKRISENLASFIINNSINERTKTLLEQSQEQKNMLRSQEEEMRQNFEELQSTQEEMSRVQTELRAMKDHLEVELNDKIKELENYKKNIDVLMNSSEDAIIYTNETGAITMCNPRASKMFGYKQDELMGKSINLLFNCKQKTIDQCFNEILKGKSKIYEEINGKSKMYGFEFPVELKIGKGEDNGKIIYSLMARDITKRKKKEENMQKSLLQVQELQQLLAQKQLEFNTTKKVLKEKEAEIQILKTK